MRDNSLPQNMRPTALRHDHGELSTVGIVGTCVADMLRVSGRIAFSELQKIHLLLDQEAFIQYVRRPALVGSAILSGTLEASTILQATGKNHTVAFDVVGLSEEAQTVSETLQNAIYPLVKNTFLPTANGRFSIGRESGNDIIMPDIALSKCHAAIDVTNRSYHLSDCGSTNGTMLNGQRLGDTPVPITDGDVISFARYEFTFMVPQSLHHKLSRGSESG